MCEYQWEFEYLGTKTKRESISVLLSTQTSEKEEKREKAV